MLQPRISENSRIHYRRPAPVYDDTKCRRRGRNDGKLAQLMDMPLDVFFEVCTLCVRIYYNSFAKASPSFISRLHLC